MSDAERSSTEQGPLPSEDGFALHDLVAIAMDSKWSIMLITATAIVGGALSVFFGQPIYRSSALLQIERKQSTSVLEELSGAFSGETAAAATIEILRSRSLVGSVVDALHLDIEVSPTYLPGLGARRAREHSGAEIAPPWLGLSGFAWGGERIEITELEVPANQLDEELRLVAEADGHFSLHAADGAAILSGSVGELVERNGYRIQVDQLKARTGSGFELLRRYREDVIDDLIKDLGLSEKSRETGIVRVSLDGHNPARVSATVDALIFAYVRMNVERRSQEAAHMLEFINTQLPVLRANLEEAETKLNSHKTARGAVDLSLVSESLLKQIVDVEQQLSHVSLQRTEQRQRFTDSHPTIRALGEQERQLRNRVATLQARIKDLPAIEMEVLPFMRDVQVNRDLYVLLLNKAQELKVAKSGTVANAHIIDHAYIPREPVQPRPAVNLSIAAVLGLTCSFGFAIARRHLRPVVDNPDVVEQAVGAPVYACVPHSNEQAAINKELSRWPADAMRVLARHATNDPAVESLRSLRTSVQFALLESTNNAVAIAGPAPHVGKTFVALNLAHIFSDCGKNVLFIDGDMRRGTAHRYLGLPHTPGLAEVIRGEVELERAIRRVDVGAPEKGVIRLVDQNTDDPGGERQPASGQPLRGLWVLPRGTAPANPAELLSSESFHRLFKQAGSMCDVVVIDLPPTLAVTDGALIGRLAGVNLMVLRAGHHTLAEIAFATRRLGQDGVRIRGFVLNDVPQRAGWYGRSHYVNYYNAYRYEQNDGKAGESGAHVGSQRTAT